MTSASLEDNPFDPNTPNLSPETFALEQVIEQALVNFSLGLRVALPARVERCVGDSTVDLLPMYQTCFVGRAPENMAQLRNVPVVMPQGNGWRVAYPITPGDTGLCVFADRNLDTFLASDAAQPVDPADSRAHALADAVFIPGLVPNPKQTTDVGTDLVLTNGHTEVRLREDGTLSVKNDQSELIDLLDKIVSQNIQLAQALQTAQTLTAFGPAPFLASSIAQFTANQSALQALRQSLDTFKSL
jgi:hypothetical protein